MRRRFSLSVRSLLALPLALQALVGSVVVTLMAQHHFAVTTREEMATSLTIKTQLIHHLLSRELELLNQHAIAFAEEVPFVTEADLVQHFQRQSELFELDTVLISLPDQAPLTIGSAIPLGTEAWLWTDTEIIARAVLPTGITISTALSRDRLYEMLNSNLSERLCIEIQTVPPSVPLNLNGDCSIEAVGLTQAGSEWQYAQNFAIDMGLIPNPTCITP